ncbi:MAG: class B sortase [Oscillospiraceae bacterium]|nr:class B sortase [Oscillospiraceae bacterium]
MSKEPEESVVSQEDKTDDSVIISDNEQEIVAQNNDAEHTESANEPVETIQDDDEITPAAESDTQDVQSPEIPKSPPNDTKSDKIKAFKLALSEEIQKEETKLQIADKVKRFKNAKENGEESQSEVKQETPVTPETEAENAPEAKPKKKTKSSKKSKKKKRGFSLFPQRGDSPFEVIRKFIFLSSSAIFIACLCLIVNFFWENHQNSLLISEMESIYTSQPEEIEETTEEIIGYEYYGYLPNVENLLAVNPDVIGWLSIPGTSISYPVLQRREPDGNDFYLERNIKMQKAKAGSIFMDFRNNFDYVVDGKKELENSGNLIVYGHNMHDYSMFGSLKHYVNNVNYYGEHPIVELNSNYKKYKYKIFGFIIVDIDDETETKFDYWNQLDFADERAFYDYVNEIKRRTIRLNDVDVKYGDELLTLSTCNSTFSDGRLVVFARKLRDGEDPMEGTQTSTKNPNIKWPNSYYKWHKNTYDPDAEFVPYG